MIRAGVNAYFDAGNLACRLLRVSERCSGFWYMVRNLWLFSYLEYMCGVCNVSNFLFVNMPWLCGRYRRAFLLA